ncbi:ribosome modulation factor [Rhodobium gokarnense]|uniref:Uncharacterized protein n=1 Tax=Rhodobium gokarnense TaxID=364296 RepID=A0ABT3HH29_9HYPH|nr:hypothetical protein [Rhodobium gokarnense]MCW2309696.1 hypothetical protein [Rhodobium gokarnense]
MTGEGDNIKGMVIFHHGRIKRATAEKDSAVGSLRNAKKQAITDEIDVEALEFCAKLQKAKKPHEVVQHLKNKILYAGYLGLDLPRHFDLFDEPKEDRTPIEDKAHEDGLRAGLQDDVPEANPHDPTSATGQSWLRGFHAGTAQRKQILEMQAEVIKGEGDEGDDEETVDDSLDEAIDGTEDDDDGPTDVGEVTRSELEERIDGPTIVDMNARRKNAAE